MKRALLFSVAILTALAVGCAIGTIKDRTETMVISYETIGTIAFPTVLAYLQQREINGSLTGEALINTKQAYAEAKLKYIQAGNTMITIVEGTAQPVTPAMITVLLREVAIALANLSAPDGGKVEGNTLTIPKVGGIQ